MPRNQRDMCHTPKKNVQVTGTSILQHPKRLMGGGYAHGEAEHETSVETPLKVGSPCWDLQTANHTENQRYKKVDFGQEGL